MSRRNDPGVDRTRDAQDMLAAVLPPETYDDELAADPYVLRDYGPRDHSDFVARNIEGDDDGDDIEGDDDGDGEPPEPPEPPAVPAHEPSASRALSACDRALAQVLRAAAQSTNTCTLRPLPAAHARAGTTAVLVLKANGRKVLYR